jgi:hypothetical protein
MLKVDVVRRKGEENGPFQGQVLEEVMKDVTESHVKRKFFDMDCEV